MINTRKRIRLRVWSSDHFQPRCAADGAERGGGAEAGAGGAGGLGGTRAHERGAHADGAAEDLPALVPKEPVPEKVAPEGLPSGPSRSRTSTEPRKSSTSTTPEVPASA